MRTVYATTLEIKDTAEIPTALDYVGRWIHDWYRRQRVPINVRENLAIGDLSMEPMEGHRISIRHHTATGEPRSRLADIVWNYPDQYDPSLGWVVSIAALNEPNGLTLSLDLAVTGLQLMFAPANIKLGSPRVIRDISRLRSVRIGGHPYNVTPEVIGAEEVEALVSELTDASRPFPVVLVSRGLLDDRPLIDTSSLAERLAGVAKIYELADKWASFRLTELLTNPLSCFGGAVRLYWPRFSSTSNPFLHPLWMPWQFKGASSERTLSELVNFALDAAAFRHIEPSAISRLRQLSAREQREANRADSRTSTDQLLEDLVAVESQLKDLQQAHAALSQENEILRGNAMALAAHFGRSNSTAQSEVVVEDDTTALEETPKSVADAVRLVEARAKFITFVESAHSSAAESPFRHPDRAYQALMAIEEVTAIWAGGINTGKSIGSMRDLFKKRGFEYADDVSQTSKGKWGNEYVAHHKGRELDISPHITIGAKQADSCLSVHWAWDKDEVRAVIAHVGRHKTNTKT